MNNKTNSTLPPEPDAAKPEQVDETRRRLGKVGVAGSGVILTLASRSVLGGWGECTGSEMMSGNLSRPGTPNPCGCSPGYWRNHQSQWDSLVLDGLISNTYASGATFNTAFEVVLYAPDITLHAASDKDSTAPLAASVFANCNNDNKKNQLDGTVRQAVFHATAGVLNASVYGARYPTPAGYNSPADIVSKFKAALTSAITTCDKSYLVDFKDKLDIYDSGQTWCFGEQHQ